VTRDRQDQIEFETIALITFALIVTVTPLSSKQIEMRFSSQYPDLQTLFPFMPESALNEARPGSISSRTWSKSRRSRGAWTPQQFLRAHFA
jgi:hypothetical protein